MSIGMKRLLDDDGRQFVVACPSCRVAVGLWTRILERAEFDRIHPTVDLTAALSPHQERGAAMQRSAERADLAVSAPWVQCLFCGYDGMYQFGGGMPGNGLYQVGDDARAALDRVAAHQAGKESDR